MPISMLDRAAGCTVHQHAHACIWGTSKPTMQRCSQVWNVRVGACVRTMHDVTHGLSGMFAPGNRHALVGCKVNTLLRVLKPQCCWTSAKCSQHRRCILEWRNSLEASIRELTGCLPNLSRQAYTGPCLQRCSLTLQLCILRSGLNHHRRLHSPRMQAYLLTARVPP